MVRYHNSFGSPDSNINPQTSEPFSEEEYEQTKIVDFRTIINFQINDCRRILNNVASPEIAEMLKEAVETFESLLSFIWDDGYRKKLDELNQQNALTLKLMSTTEKQQRRYELEKVYYRKKFELLLNKATRKGFTLARDVKDVI